MIDKNGNTQVNQKNDKSSGFLFDKVTIFEALVGVIVIIAGMLFIFYLAGVF